MSFPGCGCYRVKTKDEDVVAVLRGYKFRCGSCGSADRTGVHSLIPQSTVVQELAFPLCAPCHFKVVGGTLDIRNNVRAQRLLKKWEASHPEARANHPDSFPDEYFDDD